MPALLFHEIVFGPVKSRRLGVSLGINLLPTNGKLCSFDCIYCECGFNSQGTGNGKIPAREEVRLALKSRLKSMKERSEIPDAITFAGNGEPTLHPEFAGIIDDTLALRNATFPEAKVTVLSNSTQIHKPEVFSALMKIDNNILKLDSGNQSFVDLLNRPQKSFYLEKTIENLKRFQGKLIIQTMFVKGEFDGRPIDNTSPADVACLIEALHEIKPASVMVYTIDRETPAKKLQKVSAEELNRIATQIRKAGFSVN
jgi:wyosine [tRNA(Phe)-imidazoG37] synthetase (radical SAM superfamily)